MLRMSAFATAAAAALALLAWQTLDSDRSVDTPPIVFHSLAEHPVAEVKSCLLEGNGSKAFSGFESINVRRDYSRAVVLIDDRKSRLFIGRKGSQTAVNYRSQYEPTDEQIDLLRWCSNDPTKLWLPKHIRQ